MVVTKKTDTRSIEENKNPGINSHTYVQLTYNKEARMYHVEKTASSISGAGKTGQLHVKEWIRTFSNTTHRHTNSKWIIDFNVRLDTIKLIQET